MKIVPTILTDNIDTFNNQLKKIEDFSDEVDIDFIDGTLFDGKKTLPILDMLSVETSLVRHLHLMTVNPMDVIESVLEFGIRSVIVHAEADLKWINFSEIPLETGIAISPETPVKSIEIYLKSISTAQIMTVNPGAQGNVFLSDQLKKIPEIRAMGFNGNIKIDGGVNKENISMLEKEDIDTVYVGSAIWKSENPSEAYKMLQEIIQNN